MKTSLQKYPDYKPSGVAWLGEVPAHWEVTRVTRLCAIGSGGTPPTANHKYYGGTVPWITTSELRESVICSTKRTLTEKALTDFPALSIYPVNSVVVAMYGATIGRVGILGVPAAVNQACCVFKVSECLSSRYLFLWFQSKRSHLVSLGYGGAQPNLSQELLSNLRLPLPPLAEQRAIVRYLNHMDECIQRYISAKEQLVALLEEERKVVIHRAVTRGLDPEVSLKPSGVEWLGEVPAHWEVVQLGRIGRFSKGTGGTKEDEVSDGIPCVRYGDLYTSHKFFIQNSRAFISDKAAMNYAPMEYGDVLFAASGETIEEIGKSAVNLIKSQAYCGGDVILFHPQIELDARFSGYAFDSPESQYQKSCMGRGTTIMHVYGSGLKYLWLGLPPLAEQRAIVEHLDQVTVRIDSAITRTRRQIALLREYRTCLIADVVTGKLDVRETAETLPS